MRRVRVHDLDSLRLVCIKSVSAQQNRKSTKPNRTKVLKSTCRALHKKRHVDRLHVRFRSEHTIDDQCYCLLIVGKGRLWFAICMKTLLCHWRIAVHDRSTSGHHSTHTNNTSDLAIEFRALYDLHTTLSLNFSEFKLIRSIVNSM